MTTAMLTEDKREHRLPERLRTRLLKGLEEED